MDYALNPRARFDYEIRDTIVAGLVLEGHEVKAVKTGKAAIKGSYVKILGGKPYIIGATVSPYQPKNTPAGYDPNRDRLLLISKKELADLIGLAKSQGSAFVPIKLFDKNGLVKLEIGIARGKKKYDKRDTIKKRDLSRAKQRGAEE